MKKSVIFLVERNDSLRGRLHSLLLRQGFEIIVAPDAQEVFRALRQKRHPALLIINASLDTANDGWEMAQLLRQENKSLPVILLAPNSTEALAIAALKAGVVDYFKQPFSCEELLASVHRCIVEQGAPGALNAPEAASKSVPFIGDSPQMRAVKAYLRKVATTDTNTFITGETGTGADGRVSLSISESLPRPTVTWRN